MMEEQLAQLRRDIGVARARMNEARAALKEARTEEDREKVLHAHKIFIPSMETLILLLKKESRLEAKMWGKAPPPAAGNTQSCR
jgi:hypothetical protein